jgi:hypothetical protein
MVLLLLRRGRGCSRSVRTLPRAVRALAALLPPLALALAPTLPLSAPAVGALSLALPLALPLTPSLTGSVATSAALVRQRRRCQHRAKRKYRNELLHDDDCLLGLKEHFVGRRGLRATAGVQRLDSSELALILQRPGPAKPGLWRALPAWVPRTTCALSWPRWRRLRESPGWDTERDGPGARLSCPVLRRRGTACARSRQPADPPRSGSTI